jgi:two-component system sensor histidine kinase CpxA
VSKLNPANSLFGKIFIWFWLSVTTLLICAFIFARLIRGGIDVAEPSQNELTQGQKVANFVQVAMTRGFAPQRALRRVASRGKWQLMLVDAQTQALTLGFPELMLPAKQPMIALASQNQIVHASTPSIDFVGPFTISTQSGEYKLFVGRLLRREERRPESWGLGLIIILGIGSLLCVLLAWRLSKPLRELGQASKAFADGDRQLTLKKALKRHDEIGQLANDFNTMATKINASMQQQKMLLANVSHELRTPLTRLQLASAMLQEKYVGDDYLSRYLNRIEAEIVTMDTLIGQILKLSRMQNAKHGLGGVHEHAFSSLSLNDALGQTIDNLRFEASANHKELQCKVMPQCALRLNKDALASAFENITRNAIVYAKTCVWVSTEQTDSHVHIYIEDDGEGLQEEALAHLFEAFYQANNKRENITKGSGLGLAIAKAGVALNHGELLVAKSSKGGLRFTISLEIPPPQTDPFSK